MYNVPPIQPVAQGQEIQHHHVLQGQNHVPEERITVIAKKIKPDTRFYEPFIRSVSFTPASKHSFRVTTTVGGAEIKSLGSIKLISRSWKNVIKETAILSAMPLLLGLVWPLIPVALVLAPIMAGAVIVSEIGRGAMYRFSSRYKKVEIEGKSYYVSRRDYSEFIQSVTQQAPQLNNQKNVTQIFNEILRANTVDFVANYTQGTEDRPRTLNERLKQAMLENDEAVAIELLSFGVDPNTLIPMKHPQTGRDIVCDLYFFSHLMQWSNLLEVMNARNPDLQGQNHQALFTRPYTIAFSADQPPEIVQDPQIDFPGAPLVDQAPYIQRLARAVSGDNLPEIHRILREFRDQQRVDYHRKVAEFRPGHTSSQIKDYENTLLRQQREDRLRLRHQDFIYRDRQNVYRQTNFWHINKMCAARGFDLFGPDEYAYQFQANKWRRNFPHISDWRFLGHYSDLLFDPPDYDGQILNVEVDDAAYRMLVCQQDAFCDDYAITEFLRTNDTQGFLNFINRDYRQNNTLHVDAVNSLLDREITICGLQDVQHQQLVESHIRDNGKNLLADGGVYFKQAGSLRAHILKKINDEPPNGPWSQLYTRLFRMGVQNWTPCELRIEDLGLVDVPVQAPNAPGPQQPQPGV